MSEAAAVARLEGLADAGRWDRLLDLAREELGRFPHSLGLHEFCARSLLNLDEDRQAWPHLEFLLREDPDSAWVHRLAAIYYLNTKSKKKAREHSERMMQLAPGDADSYYIATLVACSRLQLKRARQMIWKARSLSPEDPDIINLHVILHGLGKGDATRAWLDVAELERALALEPENDLLHASLGNIYYEKLDDYKKAESCFREALRLDPRSKEHQRMLFHAVSHRSFIYRVLSIPLHAWEELCDIARGMARQPWRLIFPIIFFKFVLALLAWLLLATIVFVPAAKIYEWLLVSEIRSASSNTRVRIWSKFQAWPLWLRWSLLSSLIAGFWAAFFSWATIPQGTGFRVLGWFVLAHAVLMLLIIALRKGRAARGRRLARRASISHLQRETEASRSLA